MTDTPARDALRKRLYVQTGAPVPVSRHNVDRTLASVLNNPALTLAALVEAHGLDEVLRVLGGEPHWRRLDPMGSVLTQGWRFPTKETTDVE